MHSKEIRPKGELELEKFSKLVNLIEKKSEMVVAYHLKHSFRLVSFNEPKKDNSAGNIELENIENNSEAEKTLWKASKYSKQLPKSVGSCQFPIKGDIRRCQNWKMKKTKN